MKTLIIIPAYNEELNIGSVIDDINSHLSGVDIVVINDGSKDRTAETASAKGAKVVSLPFNLGIGAAMQTGYKYAAEGGYDVAVQFDGDGQHKAEEVGNILRPIVAGQADISVGSRFLNKGSYEAELARLLGIGILSRFISIVIGQKITDPTSGFRAVNRNVISYFVSFYPDDYPEPEVLVLLHRSGFRIAEVPTEMRKRLLGNSSITLIRGFYYMVKVVLAIFVDLIKSVPGR